MLETVTFLSLTVVILSNTEGSHGKTVEDTVSEWQKYQMECEMKMAEDPYPAGVFCNRTFDMYACWGDGLPNTTVQVPCPEYLPWSHLVRGGFVLRKCGPDGSWEKDESGLPWRDHSQCHMEDWQPQKQATILELFRLMYTVGYALSLATLTLALFVLLVFRKLRCTRNYIHMNLFLSFMMRAISILTRDGLLKERIRKEIQDDEDISLFISNQAVIGCRVAQVLTQYCVQSNYYWLLVEGLYLHNLLVMMAFSEETYFLGYLVFGWGTPLLFVIPWVLVRYFYENTQCWEINENMAHWWIIRSPILLAILINFLLFIRIIKILISKLRAHQMRYSDYKFRLAKSTLTLIPLLGIHEVVFAAVPDEQATGTLRYIKLFYELLLSSLQGLLVAILYCFINKEVQAEIRRKWQRRKLGRSLLEENRAACIHKPEDRHPNCPSCQHRASVAGRRVQREKSNHYSNVDSNDSSGNSFSGHHHRASSKGSKAYCYISSKKVPSSGSEEEPAPDTHILGNKFSESYC
ncbi:gastric inhibitory polypeptide receptor [Ambystoma mexicanum]|uniref:gastric inhibitory polypeptide receptor n=1 Tax=Ambystoma mexicanum TaxID=8296 RepID=UPI0037E8B645